MTKEALNKLNEQQKHYCTVLSTLISRDRAKGAQSLVDKERGELRGYLECMKDMGMITEYEMRALYTWFSTEDREVT